MWVVKENDEATLYYNKKENAIKEAKEYCTNFINDVYGSIEEFNKINWASYDSMIKEIETGNFYDDIIDISEIETED